MMVPHLHTLQCCCKNKMKTCNQTLKVNSGQGQTVATIISDANCGSVASLKV